jgi:hypothetical protein
MAENNMEKVEFEFPDPDAKESKKVAAESDDDIEIDVVDDTPAKDRNRKPADPPQDITEEELGEYSEKVRKRIQHFSKGYHDERRAKEAAFREREEAVRIAKLVADENKRLKGTVNKNQEALLEQAKLAASLELEDVKRVYKQAYEAGDSDAVVNAQEALTAAKMKAERVNNFKLNTLQEDENEVQQPQYAPQAYVDEKATRWQQNNPWYGSDDEMTSFALGLHTKLVKQGVDPRSDEYYERINSRMRQVFPEQFDDGDQELTEEAPRRRNVVAPVTRSTAPKKIVLTQTQVSIAKRLGVPLELYAKQVAEDMRKQ